jgi:diguanylate cyclase (GGDEF)-like protein
VSLKVKLVGYFVLLSLVPLAAATIGFRTVLTHSEERRVDVRLEAGLRAALGAYQDELRRASLRVNGLAANRDVQIALQRHNRRTLRAAIAATPNVRIVGPGIDVGSARPGATRTSRVTGPGGRLLGTIVTSVPLDVGGVRALRTNAGIMGADRLVAVRNGSIEGGGGALRLQSGKPGTVGALGGRYRALRSSALLEPRGVSFAVLAPQHEIDRAVSSAELSLAGALLASLLLIGVVAYIIGRSIVRGLGRLASAADDIAAGRAGVRVPVGGGDEFAQLGRAFNSMAGQLEHRLDELTVERNRLREVTTIFGDALRATHDAEQLKQVVVDAAVEATAANGGVLIGPRGDRGEAGRTDVGDDRIELLLDAGDENFGTLVLNADAFSDEQRELAASLVTPAVVALENARLHRIVERQAMVDGLTGLANRRHADEQLAAELRRAERFSAPLAIVLADLDNFKRVNDRHGHPVGDTVLREFARTLHDSVRDIDLAGRWGGEEFVLILPGTDAQGAAHLAERVREAILQRPVLAPDGSRIAVSASFGVAAYPDLGSAAELILAADGALYAAKRTGKDRVVTAPAPAPRG